MESLKPAAEQRQRWMDLGRRLDRADDAQWAELIAAAATRTRRRVVEMIAAAGAGHIGGDFSVTDILTVLFNGVLRIDPARPDQPERDHVILSKGHCAAALYATLASCGYFSPAELPTFMAPLSPLNGHPNRVKVPGVETNTGPLGHGLPVGVGTALGTRLAGRDSRTFVVLGDGELQEGSNWEAMMAASHYGLTELVIIIDRNRLQQGARTEETNRLDPLDDRLAAFGWEVRTVDGHDHRALRSTLTPAGRDRPVAVIANTIKGKGVSFIEDRVEWHHKVPTDEQVRLALAELAQAAEEEVPA
ncbi:transketolase [Microlunatus speluncae]|uniref:transketolase n=1 Tax=Microlunatus speluncae TaxID=2594267 RepID=UPI001C2D99BA|nr:transketolase [Microlunatus speluncae]